MTLYKSQSEIDPLLCSPGGSLASARAGGGCCALQTRAADTCDAKGNQGGADLHWAVDARIAASVGDPAWVAGGDNQTSADAVTAKLLTTKCF